MTPSRRRSLLLPLIAALLLFGCSDDPVATPDAAISPDAAAPDAAAPDAGPDLGADQSGIPDWPLHDGQAPDLGAVPPLQWVTIAAGSFSMGSPKTEDCREPEVAKETQHPVTLTHAFQLSRHEVTQQQFQALIWYNPAKAQTCGGSCPVEMINWSEAVAYVNALSRREGFTPCYQCSGHGKYITCKEASAYAGQKIYDCPGYRLPTEAEWEFAYRAGTKTSLYNGQLKSCVSDDKTLDSIGWYGKNSGGSPHPVGKKTANALGLHDMAGNVWEWCHDGFTQDLGATAATDPWGSSQTFYRMIRGGSWFGDARNCRAAHRFQKEPTYRCHGIGLRVARTVTGGTPDAGATADTGAAADAGAQ